MPAQGLIVRLNGRVVGSLNATRRGARFRYDEKVVDSSLGQPVLSLALPAKRRPYAEGLTGNWFRGLLPEGDRLTAVCRSIGCDESDYLSVLERIGWECAGAVSVSAPGFDPPAPGRSVRLSQEELCAKLRELPAYGGIDPTARVSLGGFQEKLLVVASDIVVHEGHVKAGIWAQPDAAAISTHIIKPQPQGRYPHIIEAEAWAMEAARHAARCSDTALLQLEDAPLSLVVRRFDRICRDGVCRRIHQEDCCQALGLPPTGKYAGVDVPRGTDPTYAGIARLLDQFSADSLSEQRELLRQMVTNLVLGNTDAHAKNYALLYAEPSSPSLAPLYDVVPVVDIEPRARHLSMRVGGAIEFARVGREHVIAEARSWGMTASAAEGVLDETLERLVAGIGEATDLYPRAGSRHGEAALARARELAR